VLLGLVGAQPGCDPHLRARITRESLATLDLALGQPVWALIKGVSFDAAP